MEYSDYKAQEVGYGGWKRATNLGLTGGSYASSMPIASPVYKRRSHFRSPREVPAGQYLPKAVSLSLTCRVRKVRNTQIAEVVEDSEYASYNQSLVNANVKNTLTSHRSGSSQPCGTTSKPGMPGVATPKLLHSHNDNASTGESAVQDTQVQWPPSSIEVLHDLENYVEINFADYRPLYDRIGPVAFRTSLSDGLNSASAELRLLPNMSSMLISQNSTQRVVYNAYWLPKQFPKIALKVAVKSVKDCNVRDGRSIKREIGCHLYIYQKLVGAARAANRPLAIATDEWPTSEVLGYYLDKNNPGTSVLVTRKLLGPDFFDIIRSECSPRFGSRNTPLYELNKLDWCIIAMERVAQLSELGIRHNDLKPDNIVLDMYETAGVKRVDVKVIDLGAASLESTKEFTGGTSWYESPEQKLLEYYTKKHQNPKRAQTIEIGQSSDAWGIGQSVIEVLLGRRVVDCLRPPLGNGPPELLDPPQEVGVGETDPLWWNRDEYWTVPPRVWRANIRQALKMDSPRQKFPICAHAARFVFERLMQVDPRRRASVRSVADGLRLLAKGEIAKHI
ncbi:protein kinase domain protein [Babesia caballi]|uniref:Protein kinase domain protein n=1 Tax=Babesia caballi TaxID=5871 RepID=A0AAV4LL90_BABCB|nr:protein kinase domain protein [Babesia caballi]